MSQMRDFDDDIRVPPHDIQAEMCVLGSMALAADAVYLARNRLAAESFYNLAHQDIFTAMMTVADENKAIDPVVLRDELERSQKLEAVGGMSYVVKVTDATPTSGNAEHYIEIVRECALRRHLIATSGRIADRAYLIHEDADSILDEAEREVLAVRDSRGDSSIRKAPDVLLDVMDRLEETRRNPGQLVGLDTGFQRVAGGEPEGFLQLPAPLGQDLLPQLGEVDRDLFGGPAELDGQGRDRDEEEDRHHREEGQVHRDHRRPSGDCACANVHVGHAPHHGLHQEDDHHGQDEGKQYMSEDKEDRPEEPCREEGDDEALSPM